MAFDGVPVKPAATVMMLRDTPAATTTPALVDAIARVGPDGRTVTTFGVAFVF